MDTLMRTRTIAVAAVDAVFDHYLLDAAVACVVVPQVVFFVVLLVEVLHVPVPRFVAVFVVVVSFVVLASVEAADQSG